MNMKLLKDILHNVNVQTLIGDDKNSINKIVFESKKCEVNTLFCAIPGNVFDGHKFIDDAIISGATAIVCEKLPKKLKEGITYIKVRDSRESLSFISSNFFENPSKKIKVIGVTGTNGKTTIATLLFNLFRQLKYNCGLISTIENRINDFVFSSSSTTPDSIKTNELLSKMVLHGCKFCFMEVSSHGIKQSRILGINFACAVFTNISRDHLDYHKNLEDYVLTKKKFFDDLDSSSIAFLNKDDTYSETMVKHCESKKVFYSIDSQNADHRAEILKNNFSGLEIKIDEHHLKTKITGYFNVYNLLAIYSVAVRLHSSTEDIIKSIRNLENILGRFNIIKSKSGVNMIIDYAHSPGAIDSLFKSIYKIKDSSQKIITVVGCGGNRDVGKRPMMGKISYVNSDISIFTADNPRDEDIMCIINEMSLGINFQKEKTLIKITDRREAINEAIKLADRNDIVLILGKGHEKYQEINGKKYPFDDYVELKKFLK